MLRERLVGAEPGGTAAPGGCHAGQAEAVIFHRQVGGGMRPILENLPLLALGTVELQRLVRRQPRPEHVMVRPFNDCNGIDLDVTQAAHDLWHRVRLQFGGQGAQCESSGLGERQVRHRSHRLTLLQRPSYPLRSLNSAMSLPATQTRFTADYTPPSCPPPLAREWECLAACCSGETLVDCARQTSRQLGNGVRSMYKGAWHDHSRK